VSDGAIPITFDRQVRYRACNVCEYCLLPQFMQEATFHIDHVRPRKAGGTTTLGNLALACVACSLRKGARLTAYDAVSQVHAPIFNLRKDAWHDHFRWTPSWRVGGRTATGRATAAALGMNRPAIVAIRQELVRIGRFPPRLARDEGA
jgi:hypothetical protein